jgi:phosphohistidine phosphatase SixA
VPALSLPAGTPPRASPTGATILIPLAALPALLLWCGAASAGEGEALWSLLRGGGQVVLMRHASTDPGPGDPAGFRLDDCATQRNLSAAGREEAQRIGALFRARGVPIGQVLSSRWCRCMETARLAFGTVEPWPALDSFFNDRSRETAQTGAVRERAGERPATGNLILVTHQVNITSLTGTFPAPGEIIVLFPEGNGASRLAGRIAPPAPSPK